jgi:hypothetical protein
MRSFLVLLLPLAAAATVSGQGLTTPWDLKKTLEALQSNGNRMLPVIEQLQPAEWVANGAPDGYQAQKSQVMLQLRGLTTQAQRLASDPEKLTLALDIFLRIETFDLNLQSLAEGVRTYHNPAIAELMIGMRNENGHARQALRSYMVELAEAKEQEFKIVDQEAQKCRSQNLRRRK